ncbi:dermonecrotic toxin domain-containing protein [Pseudomonas sp. MC6]
MSEPASPLFFSETLNSPGLWPSLRKTHGLDEADFKWLAHIKLATHAMRSKQSPPMHAQRIRLNAGKLAPVTLAGSFILSENAEDKRAILYTPYEGIKQYEDLKTLKTLLEIRVNKADEEDDILAFLALSERRNVAEQSGITLTYETLDGDIFDTQIEVVRAAQRLNAEAVLGELKQLPSLSSLLETILDNLLREDFPNVRQALTRVNFYTDASAGDTRSTAVANKHWHASMSLSEALLMFYRHPQWPAEQLHEFSNPGRAAFAGDQALWENALKQASEKLQVLLFGEMEKYWSSPAIAGSARRAFFSQVLEEQARAELLIKRESGIIDATQFAILHHIIKPTAVPARRPTIENVRLWEYEPNYVELAGSLMITQANACLYTPTMGLQVLHDYLDLKNTVLSKFRAPGHEDELYGLLNLEERKRFVGFDHPHVTGENIGGETFKVLFEAIITKQRQNIAYATQVFRQSDGTVDIHALFDKALDIRAMVHERLLELDAGERWSTRPVLAGVQQPSVVLAHKAEEVIRSFSGIDALLTGMFRSQPLVTPTLQRRFLENMKDKLAHSLFVGVTGEAALRVLSGSLDTAAQAIVDTVFHPDQPSRDTRRSLNGFRPDAWSLTVQHPKTQAPLPLAHCVLLTERGGLDDVHSGRAIVWTPAQGLEVFPRVTRARRALERRLKDSVGRLSLLENLAPEDWLFHQDYTLGALRLIEDNVLHNRVQSGIEHFLARCDRAREWFKDQSGLTPTLNGLKKTPIATNLLRGIDLAKAINQQQSLPAWLGMAQVEEQQMHLELLEQWRHSVVDHKDYLSGLTALPDYVNKTLKTLLDGRFPGQQLDPQDIEIIPNLALAGPARMLSEFALNHVNIAQGTGFSVISKTAKALPPDLDQNAVRQLLLSLDIPTTYANAVTAALSAGHAEADERQQRFFRQLPWQLLQHAHELKLQQQLSSGAFDQLCQVLDMPDGIARAAVEGAHAIVSPLSLIKTAGASAVQTLGLYVIGPGKGHPGPLVLYAPYADQVLREFTDEASLIAAVNTPGVFQDLLIRRLPAAQQSVFTGLLQSSEGETSEMTVSSNAITGNLLHRFYADNLKLLPQLLACQLKSHAQADWEAAKHLFSRGFQVTAGLLPGKISYVTFLWQAYKAFKDSAENLQDHHWSRALKSFIEGAIQMISLGRLSIESTEATAAATTTASPPEESDIIDTTSKPPAPAPAAWSQLKITSPWRTELQTFETPAVALEDLKRQTKKGTFEDPVSRRTYTAVDGKVVQIKQPGAMWQMVNDGIAGPSLTQVGSRLLLAPDRHAVHYGKAMSTLYKRYSVNQDRRALINIEAMGMNEIRRNYPHKARVIQHAVDLARFYAFNCLHNLAQLKANVPGTRLDGFLRVFFGVPQVDLNLLSKLNTAIVPICKALVDPDDDLMNTERFVVGSNTYFSSIIAFVLNNDDQKKVHFTENFFHPQLDGYKPVMPADFNIDGHAQAATLIHEFAHQFSNAEDIASLEARRPFHDLITTLTSYGRAIQEELVRFQADALSITTPRDELFARWSRQEDSFVDLDQFVGGEDLGKEILTLTRSPDMEKARDAFLDQGSPDVRIDVILRNADSIARLVCEMGRQLDPVPLP